MTSNLDGQILDNDWDHKSLTSSLEFRILDITWNNTSLTSVLKGLLFSFRSGTVLGLPWVCDSPIIGDDEEGHTLDFRQEFDATAKQPSETPMSSKRQRVQGPALDAAVETDFTSGDMKKKKRLLWKFTAVMPRPEELEGLVMRVPTLTLAADSKVSFETICRDLEHEFTRTDYGFVCECCECASPCSSCQFARGFHVCANRTQGRKWYRKGTLFNDVLDVQRVLFELHRKSLPLDLLESKAQEYVEAGHITSKQATEMLAIIVEQRGDTTIMNESQINDDGKGTNTAAHGEQTSKRLSTEELRTALAQREANLRRPTQITSTSSTDQWRIYAEICFSLQGDKDTAMFVQASAGAGKSYLLETICLWLLVRNTGFKACTPTGIAAANISVDGTDVVAATMHSLFGLDEELGTSLDFTQTRDPKVRALLDMRVLLIDEVSMMDIDAWGTIKNILAEIRLRRPGPMHVLMFGDLKQLPPATSKAPFIVDPVVKNTFAFRVLRENRRIVADEARTEELENYHNVLDDMGHGRATMRVKRFFIDAYVRAAFEKTQTATGVPLEGYTSIFTKRRHSNRWSKTTLKLKRPWLLSCDGCFSNCSCDFENFEGNVFDFADFENVFDFTHFENVFDFIAKRTKCS